MNSWGSYTPGVDIGTDGLDNDGDNLIDGDDRDESGSPRESALNISVRRLTEDIVNEISKCEGFGRLKEIRREKFVTVFSADNRQTHLFE